MRTAFFRTLLDLAAADSRVSLVVGDLGFGVVEPFAEKFPERFVNAGVAEQSMTGIAAGMALTGKIVFTYSIANFPTIRCLEQIRNDVCYHGIDVKIVAVGGGFAYGALGMTHHATEDLALMRALPGMVVVAPGDPIEVERATRAIVEHRGPCYLRLGRVGEPRLHDERVPFQLGRAIEVRAGGRMTIIATGSMLATAVAVADRLGRDGIDTRVLSMHTVKPLDADAVLAAARDTRAIVTLEEHSVIGGLGSAVAETLAESGVGPIAFKRLGLASTFASGAGSREHLLAAHGLSEDGIRHSLKPILDLITH
jgi:transketolase